MSRYVEDLKGRIQRLECILSEVRFICVGDHVIDSVSDQLFPRANVKAQDLTAESLRQSLDLESKPPLGLDTNATKSVITSETQKAASSDDDAKGLEEPEEETFVAASRYQGRSSASALLSDALTLSSDVGDHFTFNDIMSRHRVAGRAYYLVRPLSAYKFISSRPCRNVYLISFSKGQFLNSIFLRKTSWIPLYTCFLTECTGSSLFYIFPHFIRSIAPSCTLGVPTLPQFYYSFVPSGRDTPAIPACSQLVMNFKTSLRARCGVMQVSITMHRCFPT